MLSKGGQPTGSQIRYSALYSKKYHVLYAYDRLFFVFF